MKLRSDCPGCHGMHLSDPWLRPEGPVIQNYRFATPEEAAHVTMRPMALVECGSCGHIFNSCFEPEVMPYDSRYENRQNFSEEFMAHLNSLAADLVSRHGLQGRSILEVGCGKGDFLRLICRMAGAGGDGYDTSYEPQDAPDPAGVNFHASYLSAGQVTRDYQVIICRHVVEHIGEIQEFFVELCAISRAAGNAVVVVETPRWEWIEDNLCLWDVFYEHCNYFTESALASIAQQAGFEVVHHKPVFDGQYQLLEVRPALVAQAGYSPGTGQPSGRLQRFAQAADGRLRELVGEIDRLAGSKPWAVWGAGAKGVALANLIRERPPLCVIDVNPAKQGAFTPGSGARVTSPAQAVAMGLGLVVVANPNYRPEIEASLAQLGYTGALICA